MKFETVRIEFADPRILARDHVTDIEKAVLNSSRNLHYRYDVIISKPYVQCDKVFVDLQIPDDIFVGFRIGCHLRGIASFMLKHNELYKEYRIGTRLLYFISEH